MPSGSASGRSAVMQRNSTKSNDLITEAGEEIQASIGRWSALPTELSGQIWLGILVRPRPCSRSAHRAEIVPDRARRLCHPRWVHFVSPLPRPMRLLASALLAGGALLIATPAGAIAAPTCAEGPETVGSQIIGTPCADTIRAPRGITTLRGEGGDDILFGQRGNDSLFGGEGADRLFGGVGDDRLRGGPGADRLSGGFGADSLDGEAGDDLDRGDATVDAI